MGFARFCLTSLTAAIPVGICTVWLSHPVAAQQGPPKIEQRLSDPVYMSWITHREVSDCVSCHFAGPNPAQIESGQASNLTAFSRRIEMERWLRLDKHTIARRRVEPFAVEQNEQELDALIKRLDQQAQKAVEAYRAQGVTVDASQIGLRSVPREWIGDSNILSRRICDKLWGKGAVTTPAGYAKFRDNCLTCHGGYQQGDEGFDHASRDTAQLGIDCLYCHQLGDQDRWVAAHSAPKPEENWRLLAPEVKADAGMRNLVDTSNQASLCFDCHVGNREKDMFVTHEMYAAGHPPIPSIEVQKFCQEMPQHWQTPAELYQALDGYDGRDEYFRTNYPGLITDKTDAGDVFWNTRKMLVGALTARKQSLQLYIDSVTHQPWADYSLYDCAACHHELQSFSKRQLRGYPGAPGRPRPHEWPGVLLDLAYDIRPQMRQVESQLAGYFSDRPFGDPEVIGQAAELLRDQIDEAITVVERVPIDARIARKMLVRLSDTPANAMLTYDAARQVVWAMQTIADELEAKGNPLDASVATMIEQLGVPQQTGVAAQIPAGRERFIYRDEMKLDLERRAQFDSEVLKAKLDEIRQALNAG